MRADDFWINLRTAASFLVPSASTDSPDQDAAHFERVLRSAAIWLTTRSVDDFDPQDFAFLEPDDLRRLTRSVEAFRRVASQVPGNQPASPQQLQDAGAAFRKIIQLLRPHEFRNFDAFKSQYHLERELKGKLPSWIERFLCETGTDVADDPALWIWLYVSQEAVDNNLVVKEGQQVRDEVEAAVRRLRLGRWPYVRFQSLAELAASQKGRR